MGYKDEEILINQPNTRFIRSSQVAVGIEWLSNQKSRFTIESYFKKYSNYPFLLRDSISLANLGGDFGIIGNEPSESISSGRSYGLEFMYQQRLYKGFYGILSYTLGWSEFEDKNAQFISSSWDSRHIASLTMGKKLKNNWEIGLNWRFQSSLPNTPFSDDSNLVTSWDRNKMGLLDYNRINSERLGSANSLDVRVDKKWFFNDFSLEIYLDIENLTNQNFSRNVLILDRPLDDTGRPIGQGIIVNPNDPAALQRYKVKEIQDNESNILPTIGIVLEY